MANVKSPANLWKCLLGAGLLFGLHTSAMADNWSSHGTGYCLDSNGNGDVYGLGCNGGNNQVWYWSGARLVNYATGRCLDSDYQGKVYTLSCNNGNFQNWYRSGSRIVNYQTGLCLDGNGAGNVYTHPCNGGSFQNWD